VFRLAVGESAGVQTTAPADADIETSFGKEPQGFLGPVVAGIVGVEQQRHATLRELPRPAFDLGDLFGGDPVGHDRDRRNAQGVERQDVIEAFADDRPAVGEALAVARFREAGGVLTKQFQAAVQADGDFVFVRRFLALALVRRQGQEGSLLLLEAGIAGDPAEELPSAA